MSRLHSMSLCVRFLFKAQSVGGPLQGNVRIVFHSQLTPAHAR